MRRRRLLALWAVLATLAAAAGAWTAAGQRSADDRPPPSVASSRAAKAAPPAEAAPVPRPARRRARPRIPTGHSVRAALRRALLTGRIDRRHWARWHADEGRGRRAVRRLTGARRAELLTVFGTLDDLAATGRLTASRMPVAFLTLERNIEVWTKRRFPAPRERMTFGRDPAVFQYYAGHGVQHHPLATAGRINALVQPCLREREARDRRRVAGAHRLALRRRMGVFVRVSAVTVAAPRRPTRCHARALRRALNRLAGLASRRGDFTAWEYLFRYGAGTPPWISGMAQATAAQALARGAEALDVPRYRRVALDALGAFEAAPPLGIAVPAAGGRHYAMYSFQPDLHILNGFLQSVIGLHDVAELTGSRRAQRLFRLGERTARASVAAYDTGAWSLYSAAGRESPLSYHELVTDFLGGMCRRTGDAHYCAPERRFARYLREPPALFLAASRRIVRFRVSKVSSVSVSVRGPRYALSRRLSVPRGRWSVAWRPSRAGRYVVRVQAIGPEGRRAVRRAVVRIKPPPKPKHPKRHSELSSTVGEIQAGLGH